MCPQCPPSLKSQGPDQHKHIHHWWLAVDEPKDEKRETNGEEGTEWLKQKLSHSPWRKGERNIRRKQVMKEERDGEGNKRSWCTAVGLFTSRISLFSRCVAAHRGKGREREGQGRRSNRRMWVIGGSVAAARLDSSWCILWLALSKRYVVGDLETVVGMPCHGTTQETNTRPNNEESHPLIQINRPEKRKNEAKRKVKHIKWKPQRVTYKWLITHVLMQKNDLLCFVSSHTSTCTSNLWLYFQVLWPGGFFWQWPLCFLSSVSGGRGLNHRILVCC